MRRIFAALALSAALFGDPLPALAAEQTVTLKVDLWCPSCPYIVKRSLEEVAGVVEVDVSYRDQTAVVRFDDDKTTVAALTEATASIGFPSTPLVTN